jgi:hypothetical protein
MKNANRITIKSKTFKFNIYKDGDGVAVTAFSIHRKDSKFIQTLRFSLDRTTKEVVITGLNGNDWDNSIPQYLQISIGKRAEKMLRNLFDTENE